MAMMHDEVVKRRKWLDDQEFLDLVGATNLIPGPNSTEIAIHLGFSRAGWPGLIVGGVCFIVPAMLIVLALAWVYVCFGTAPQAKWLLYGIKPFVTLGIFLPSFIFVAISNPLIPRMRKSVWVGGLLDGINVASLGLMAAVSWQLGVASLVDPLTIAVASAALFLLIRFKLARPG
jgi:chromate transport protein ChrA